MMDAWGYVVVSVVDGSYEADFYPDRATLIDAITDDEGGMKYSVHRIIAFDERERDGVRGVNRFDHALLNECRDYAAACRAEAEHKRIERRPA